MDVDLSPAPEPTALSSAIDAPASVLVLAPHLHERHDAVCADLLTVADPAAERVLAVSVTEPVGRAHRRWDERVGERPAELAVVDVEFMHDGPAESAAGPSDASWLTSHTVGDPGDLTALGVEISAQLADWAETDEQVVVCVRSLTTMLQYVDLEALVDFLQELQGHLETVGAVSHFHLDPTAVDHSTVTTLRNLFDVQVTVGSETGALTLRESQ